MHSSTKTLELSIQHRLGTINVQAPETGTGASTRTSTGTDTHKFENIPFVVTNSQPRNVLDDCSISAPQVTKTRQYTQTNKRTCTLSDKNHSEDSETLRDMGLLSET